MDISTRKFFSTTTTSSGYSTSLQLTYPCHQITTEPTEIVAIKLSPLEDKILKVLQVLFVNVALNFLLTTLPTACLPHLLRSPKQPKYIQNQHELCVANSRIIVESTVKIAFVLFPCVRNEHHILYIYVYSEK